jgi:hypothetical protein
MGERSTVRQLDSFGSFQIDEMVEGGAVKTVEFDNYAGRIIAARYRKIWSPKMRAAANCQRQVGDEAQVRHFFDCDA